MATIFRFKEFSIDQENCAMKIGTDGVLLGAWSTLHHRPQSLLDIGAGTGVIALMLAQRSDAETIDAIEIEEGAYEQCVANFENSPWGDRLFCYHAGFDEFVEEMDEKYDLIVSNPPFYSEKVSSGDTSRDQARQNASLPFEELIEGVGHLLAEKGVFSTIVPYDKEPYLLKLAVKHGLYARRITHVKGTPTTAVKRSLIEFSFKPSEPRVEELVIEIERHRYTPEYIALTRDFYLKM
ncbi:tRNA1(Val) (adenine(37)-N6)-methyltransferase [Pseudozobellia thermophila]|uniref:tRNA1(Val) (adenine(37)-N6)-methyltransferase n=1 Tax=Pseudozobellia thermophila TaxID=192903 RepID=A0A1M6CWM7_9FLAO|nr:methyltransferase [Pseudozobellia thermophila]SHI65138.1 tRNA1Val (adenine37-N6)-methyltransferase [Pseudozobellia thermophila]